MNPDKCLFLCFPLCSENDGVWACGLNGDGQCGQEPHRRKVMSFERIPELDALGVPVSAICGNVHTLVKFASARGENADGVIACFGRVHNGALGFGVSVQVCMFPVV